MKPGEKVWKPAPCQFGPTHTGSIMGIWVFPDEEVEWIWTHTPDGSYVSGYIVGCQKKKETDMVVESCEAAVARKVIERQQVGLRKYGVGVAERQDLTVRQWLQHAQEEAMDLAVYLEKLMRDIK